MIKSYVPLILGVLLWGSVQAQETLNAPIESAKALKEANESHLLLCNTQASKSNSFTFSPSISVG
jgi:hypothetical protein